MDSIKIATHLVKKVAASKTKKKEVGKKAAFENLKKDANPFTDNQDLRPQVDSSKYFVRLSDAEGNFIGDAIAVTDTTVFPRTQENDDAYALNAPMCRVALCEELQMAIYADARKKKQN